MKTISCMILGLLSLVPARAQLAPFNDVGVTIGHVHLNVSDMEAHQRFWLSLGGTPYENKKLLPQKMIEFPGIYIILRKQDNTGGTDGSVINHIGFNVKNINDWLPKWTMAGINIQKGKLPDRVMLTGPDGIRVEIIENKSIATPIAMHHIHLFLPYPTAAQAWYVKVFGATPGERASGDGGKYLISKVPGAEFTFVKTDAALLGSRGRALDHIGFDVKDMDQFVKRLADLGVQIEYPVRSSSNDPNAKVTHITDPWGMRIELTQGSARTIRSAVGSPTAVNTGQ